ncbi:hypothetical protein DICPUDRAFT_151996 [Dictyostelium purpureum]|uniref:UspA domain-containing protein n=1 Tax=Dictyostelium purpureum TaxID=5786 RepID=F0ZK83_DICPU|nr:uncharacterized protein DICPUDRAFT_151996 [Dictyostelium purpureum]EGC35655.1 hypothetical protein DICPUDRAFT_151996 [Dictyostelium purpureum]|eukprot:XP_003287834.1 hypothetical protein DICPUDRAFT_151996 [Dictyostelium purpureum]
MVHYLLCVDGSENCNRAFQFLKNKMVDANHGDRVTLMHFTHHIETPSLLNPISDNLDKISNIEEQEKANDLKKHYADKCEKSFPEKLNWEYINVVKASMDDIIDAIKDKKPDLVVVGTRGNGFIKKMILGSFSEKIVKNSPIPVIVVP